MVAVAGHDGCPSQWRPISCLTARCYGSASAAGNATFFINGRMREGQLSLAVLQDLIERELRAKDKS